MELKQKIQEVLKIALKEKRELELSVLRMLNAAITNKEKEKRYKIVKEKPELTEEELGKESCLTDEETTEVISTEVKKRKEALLLFEKGGRQDLAEKEKKEVAILQEYLPEQLVDEAGASSSSFANARLSEEEIKRLAREAVGKVGAKEIKDMGKVMAELMPKVKGKTDGSLVSKIIRELLAQ